MTILSERERALEEKFVHDEEVRFRIAARRDKLFAQWAATQLGLPADAESQLVATTLAVRDGAGHDDRILQHMTEAFAARSHLITPAALLAALDECEARARQQIMAVPLDGEHAVSTEGKQE
jgi:hypothetical protein